jgi:hypothetical protein
MALHGLTTLNDQLHADMLLCSQFSFLSYHSVVALMHLYQCAALQPQTVTCGSSSSVVYHLSNITRYSLCLARLLFSGGQIWVLWLGPRIGLCHKTDVNVDDMRLVFAEVTPAGHAIDSCALPHHIFTEGARESRMLHCWCSLYVQSCLEVLHVTLICMYRSRIGWGLPVLMLTSKACWPALQTLNSIL